MSVYRPLGCDDFLHQDICPTDVRQTTDFSAATTPFRILGSCCFLQNSICPQGANQFPCASRGRPSERPLPLGVRHLGEAVPLALAPPVAALAGLGPGELEALRPDDVEVDLAHHVSRRGRGLLQAAAEPAGRHTQRYLYTGRRVKKNHRHINKQVVECTDTQSGLCTGRGMNTHTGKVYAQVVE